ncbi:uncharacterized protein PpBr36_09613 [Pyricularia pennisetigena]|uniref:uncharacterized protein n=1 Tax=Pyricularia pennisetigena TaxID=1578925 RepID=UPI00114F1F2D|nr:uncharacterized protein PpBr36_09613 [Pyricularia pennisetigena]TLS21925.1 hypothetical protein PpBr36_09613 [Pyricularia pennisetigena]
MFGIGIATCYVILHMEAPPVESKPLQVTPANDASSGPPGGTTRRRICCARSPGARKKVLNRERHRVDFRSIHVLKAEFLAQLLNETRQIAADLHTPAQRSLHRA